MFVLYFQQSALKTEHAQSLLLAYSHYHVDTKTLSTIHVTDIGQNVCSGNMSHL